MAEMWTISLLLFVRFAAGKLSGDHVCHTEEKYTINVTEYIVRNATVRKYQWCLNVPPRCSFYTTRLVNESHIVGKEVTDLIEKCCPGYEENNSTHTCHPKCPECKNGSCYNGKCDCSAGFKGDNCNKGCGPSEWGKNCKNQCKCHKGTCHPQYGTCDCPEGWTGRQCDFSCPHGYYGKNCGRDCRCSRGQRCHHVYGKCENQTSTTSPKPETSPETSTNTVIFQNNGKFHTDANGLVSVEPTQTMMSPDNKDVINTTSNYMLVQEVTSAGQDFNKDTKEQVNSTTTTSSTIINEMSKSKVMKAAAEKEFDNSSTSSSSAAPVENYLNDQSPQNNLEQPQQQDKNDLVNSASAATAVSITIILVAVVIVGANRMRKAKRQNKDDGPKGVPSVSVYTHTHSIFHTPLPDPPPFENPIFITPIDPSSSPAGVEGQRFETRVVCSMNFPKLPSSKDPREYLYDHPPSTGSYRAASIPEPPDIDTLSSMALSEPVYDEIPSSMAPTPISMPPPSYKSSSSLYMNTCAKTRF